MSAAEAAPPARLGLGGAGLGNHRVRLDDPTARQIIDEAWDGGARLFDTAPHYGLGLSERRLGSLLAGRRRDEFRLTTKVGRRLVARPNPAGDLDDEQYLVPADARRVWDFSIDGIRASLQDSFLRLGVDHVDCAYLHDPERWDLKAALASGLPALARLREEGLVRTIGVASMSLDALLAAVRSGMVEELMVAARLTLLDRSAVDELLPRCEEQGIAVVAAAVFNGGLLAETPTTASTHDYAPVAPEVLTRARNLDAACAAYGVPLAAAALQYPLRHAQVHSVVVGAVEPGQFRRNARLLSMPIPEELWSVLEPCTEAIR